MPSRSVIASTFAAWLACGSAFASGLTVPNRYLVPARDQNLVQIENAVDGRAWSIWAYRSGPGYDIAISQREQDGSWSEPIFIGKDNGKSEIQPSVAVDSNGTVYVVYVVWETGRVMLTSLHHGNTTWSTPVQAVFEGGRHSHPKALVLGGQLVLAYRTGQVVGATTIPIGNPVGPLGTEDGPDGYPLPDAPDSGIQPIQ